MRWDQARFALVLTIIACGALATACEKKKEEPKAQETTGATLEQPPGTLPVTEAARKEAADIFASRCATCHGPTGEGNGPASQGLTPKPRNFHDADWQKSVNDAHIDKIIEYGGAAVGKSPAMPPNPDLVSKPEVVAALREHIRSLKTQ